MEPIDKLKDKVDKDPNSTLFVPLAEEYRKAGRHDEAIDVLVAGIERQPTYTSAKVSLGKIYLDKGLTADARRAFEEVVVSNPDNFFAQKKLAEIFKATGDLPRAIEHYKILLGMNPMDDAAQAEIRALEALLSTPPAETPAEPAHQAHGEVQLSSSNAAKAPSAEEEMPPSPKAEEIASADLEEEMRNFSASLSDKDAAAEALQADESEEVFVVEEDSGASDTSEAEIMEVAEEITSEPVEVAEEIASEPVEEPSFAAMEPAPAVEPATEPESFIEPAADLDAMIGEADFNVATENYARAMAIFNDVLGIDPQNKAALQRAAELQMLMKMLGRESDMMEAKLTAFADALIRRRDEFRGNA